MQVPVELGASYMSSEWSSSLMTLSHFIDTHLQRPGGSSGHDGDSTTGYLAQHPLFDQVPELRRDIITPDFCALVDDTDLSCHCDDGEVRVNAWLGPGGTVSNLHYDPYHNLLCQVVGTKRVRLYDPAHSDALYPHAGLMCNTSRVAVEAPDLKQFPLFRRAPFLEFELTPGDMLYIPPKWWHWITSLSVSFSVSFWW